ncbi:MAG: hypothetical protein WCF54_14120 [Terracidiphilus sp.]
MQKIQIANQLRGRAIGSIFFTCFGTGWLFLALIAKQQIKFATVSAIMVGMTMLLLAALNLLRLSKRWPRVPDDPAVGRAFGWINTIQWIAVAVVAFSFAKLHIDAYVMCAITAIIGLHLFPLARIFRYKPHYWSGAVLVAWAGVSALVIPTETLQGTSSLGTGIILWLSASVTLALAFQAAKDSAEPLTS